MSAPPDIEWLRSEWKQLFATLGVIADAAEPAFADLVEAYRSPGRYYHTLDHIRHVLQTIHRLIDQARDPAAVLLAGWFHDVVYDSRAKDNEERSAAYAEEVLRRLSVGEETIRRVGALILMTKTHTAPTNDSDAHVLLDADLAILATPIQQYWRYATGIAQEYVWVPEAEYREGRRAVLEELSERMLDIRAKVNMQYEMEFLAAESPSLTFYTGIGSDRKWRLFAVAHCRQILHLLNDPRSRRAVEVAEQVADGTAEPATQRLATEEAEAVDPTLENPAAKAAFCAVADLRQFPVIPHAAYALAEDCHDAVVGALLEDAAADQQNEIRDVAEVVVQGLLRDIFGNPIRPAIMKPDWLTAQVARLAQSIYAERAFDRLPILADALEDAGCDQPDILSHCRQPGEHVRGCWVVDRVLGKS